jgi:hypothetical protein
MFLIRMMFWLAIVVMLIPSGEDQASDSPAATGGQFSVNDALGAAVATVSDMTQFCDRNHGVCETGAAAFDVFLAKAENGAWLAYRVITGARGQDGGRQGGVETRDASYREAGGATGAAPDTLRGSDLEPAWHGPLDEAI